MHTRCRRRRHVAVRDDRRAHAVKEVKSLFFLLRPIARPGQLIPEQTQLRLKRVFRSGDLPMRAWPRFG
jgi:hypothetical protein